MNILVCVKQVADMEAKFKVAPDEKWFLEDDIAFKMNEYDEYAVEEAVKFRESMPDSNLIVLSIGAERVKEAIKKALAMGCDSGVHIKHDKEYMLDSYSKAYAIYEYAKDKNFDIIFTGMQSQDRGSAQVGIILAELLGIPSVSTIVSFKYESGEVEVKRELEGGKKGVVKLKTPALFTCQLGLNTPRYPTLPNIMKAKKKSIEEIEFSYSGNLAETDKIYFPEKKGGAMIIEGDPKELAQKVVAFLKDNGLA
ncbi:MAG: electron transfer flavoprotein subunit beta/FixA family protein [Calditerrivibrio sp.]|nr:electron transfer flavoprotein subunit beta/FixA family protein [Calditerrivibrio sp.]MCA1933548.1 electron transfer flavoprotein subunit beta/FixA family protein [Calditerrivibrio sp.]MCA1981187.1 electron transfer flavoprotein subunit beta/FixA family protein [Calditerrivibrio sp.]